jgi:hypothetical protein
MQGSHVVLSFVLLMIFAFKLGTAQSNLSAEVEEEATCEWDEAFAQTPQVRAEDTADKATAAAKKVKQKLTPAVIIGALRKVSSRTPLPARPPPPPRVKRYHAPHRYACGHLRRVLGQQTPVAGAIAGANAGGAEEESGRAHPPARQVTA